MQIYGTNWISYTPTANPNDTNAWRDCVNGLEASGPSITFIRELDPQSNPPVPIQSSIIAVIRLIHVNLVSNTAIIIAPKNMIQIMYLQEEVEN